ncbi:ORF76-like protein [Bufonid herpesvirus 1]|uniref:ORF76-like protein n=1 Tax=Bufonid herpesvirus 1 TaxID=2282206 RepID=UPI000EB68D91|nr:ORF76-like protein [Bufonid herpesvirus 1]AXF48554.1 ORF76-like protein [Bufonid herpesvirus 1]
MISIQTFPSRLFSGSKLHEYVISEELASLVFSNLPLGNRSDNTIALLQNGYMSLQGLLPTFAPVSAPLIPVEKLVSTWAIYAENFSGEIARLQPNCLTTYAKEKLEQAAAPRGSSPGVLSEQSAWYMLLSLLKDGRDAFDVIQLHGMCVDIVNKMQGKTAIAACALDTSPIQLSRVRDQPEKLYIGKPRTVFVFLCAYPVSKGFKHVTKLALVEAVNKNQVADWVNRKCRLFPSYIGAYTPLYAYDTTLKMVYHIPQNVHTSISTDESVHKLQPGHYDSLFIGGLPNVSDDDDDDDDDSSDDQSSDQGSASYKGQKKDYPNVDKGVDADYTSSKRKAQKRGFNENNVLFFDKPKKHYTGLKNRKTTHTNHLLNSSDKENSFGMLGKQNTAMFNSDVVNPSTSGTTTEFTAFNNTNPFNPQYNNNYGYTARNNSEDSEQNFPNPTTYNENAKEPSAGTGLEENITNYNIPDPLPLFGSASLSDHLRSQKEDDLSETRSEKLSSYDDSDVLSSIGALSDLAPKRSMDVYNPEGVFDVNKNKKLAKGKKKER